jgi:hypothetical protein
MPPFLAGEAHVKMKTLVIIVPLITSYIAAYRTACIRLATYAVVRRFR